MIDPVIYRATVIGVLRTFASLDHQLTYQKEVPFVRVPGELYCQWFDDVYHPDNELWPALFQEDELEHLDRFAQVLEQHSEFVGGRNLSELITTVQWREIMESASATLSMIRE